MSDKFIITWTDIDLENDAENLVNNIAIEYRPFTKKELLEEIKTLIPNDRQNFAQEFSIYIAKCPLLIDPKEVVVFKNKSINYQELLVAVVTTLVLLTEELKRVDFIIQVAKYLQIFDVNIFEQFKNDIAEDVYCLYK